MSSFSSSSLLSYLSSLSCPPVTLLEDSVRGLRGKYGVRTERNSEAQ